jgi:hypothetical protein
MIASGISGGATDSAGSSTSTNSPHSDTRRDSGTAPRRGRRQAGARSTVAKLPRRLDSIRSARNESTTGAQRPTSTELTRTGFLGPTRCGQADSIGDGMDERIVEDPVLRQRLRFKDDGPGRRRGSPRRCSPGSPPSWPGGRGLPRRRARRSSSLPGLGTPAATAAPRPCTWSATSGRRRRCRISRGGRGARSRRQDQQAGPAKELRRAARGGGACAPPPRDGHAALSADASTVHPASALPAAHPARRRPKKQAKSVGRGDDSGASFRWRTAGRLRRKGRR